MIHVLSIFRVLRCSAKTIPRSHLPKGVHENTKCQMIRLNGPANPTARGGEFFRGVSQRFHIKYASGVALEHRIWWQLMGLLGSVQYLLTDKRASGTSWAAALSHPKPSISCLYPALFWQFFFHLWPWPCAVDLQVYFGSTFCSPLSG